MNQELFGYAVLSNYVRAIQRCCGRSLGPSEFHRHERSSGGSRESCRVTGDIHSITRVPAGCAWLAP
ncbi:MAG TPA: hypothetical protein VGW38_22825, partial [Chloroflexota bacterium]|nr:hypothetical protein [Chloroflexota bacterium]